MKQTIKSARMVTMGLFTLCAMGLTKVTFAGATTNDPVEITYLGKIKNLPAIQLNLNNSEAEEYFITIKDVNYHILYCEIVKGANLSKIIKLNMDNDDLHAPGFMVRVEVTSAKTRKTEVFNISTLTGVAENAGISKL